MEIIQVEDTDLQAIEGDRCRTFCAIPQPLTAQIILNDIQIHYRKRVIIICNTVSQAQGLFQDLQELILDEELNITLLHSRFLPLHRAQKEAFLKEKFARNWQKQSARTCQVLISTQVIEAGINITCQVMHVQLCPMNSLLQRAGRCARFWGETGEVFVYPTVKINPSHLEIAELDFDPESEEPETKSFLPYPKETCVQTWQVLQAHTVSKQAKSNVGFRTEEQWMNQVHSAEDVLQQERRVNNRMNFEQRFEDAFFRGDESAARDLIRSVDNRSVFIWEQLVLFGDEEPIDPQKLVAFSVPISTLCKVWMEFKNQGFGADWIFKRIKPPEDKETYSQPTSTVITSRGDLISSIRILVNPRYVYYSEDIGLLIGIDVFGNGFVSPEKPQAKIVSQYRYHMDTYVGHLVLMWKCWREPFATILLKNGEPVETTFVSVRDELLAAGGLFIKTKIFPQATQSEAEALFESLVFFAIFTHDLGKLQVKWQQVMRGWQAIAHSSFQGRNPGTHLLAHTDYNPEDKQQWDALKAYEKKHKRPNHAIESAYLTQEILKKSLFPLLHKYFTTDREQMQCIAYTVIMAAGRHHSAWTSGWDSADVSQVKSIQVHSEATQAIAHCWRSMTRFLPPTLPLPEANLSQNFYKIRELDFNQFDSDRIEYLQLYLLVVRALRLCDQRSVQLEH
ncbi:CRISPR-associated helicase Cas3' [Scytonema sp. NUACC26]|uniref:CRISPR-associated helicase Cas3' n=1 Tax=Scytonema sp. NUACC26 TaxID=3140176 RepID=UPI0034DBDF49